MTQSERDFGGGRPGHMHSPWCLGGGHRWWLITSSPVVGQASGVKVLLLSKGRLVPQSQADLGEERDKRMDTRFAHPDWSSHFIRSSPRLVCECTSNYEGHPAPV